MQAKAGYENQVIDWSRYKGQTVVVDRGNHALAQRARQAGLEVIESDVSLSEAKALSKLMQTESSLTGNVNAPIISGMYSSHRMGLNSAKLAAKLGVGLNIGTNLYDFVNGDKTAGEAIKDALTASTVAVGGAYGTGVALGAFGQLGSLAASTTVGGGIVTAASGVGATIAGTGIGGAVITTVGGVAATVSTVSVAIAAAPVSLCVAGAVAVGFFGKMMKKKFWD